MARISTYAIDGTPVSSDKVIGTDSSGTTTKNYPLGSVADWLKESGATAVIGQNNYKFQDALDPDEGRLQGSISFADYGGSGTAFEDITTLRFSGQSSAGQNVVDYLDTLVSGRVIIGQLDELGSFGVYTLSSFIQDPSEPAFYNAGLSFVEGNGEILANKVYGFSKYGASTSGAGPFDAITLVSEDGSSFDVVVSNAGVLVVIPEGSSEPVITSPPVLIGTEKVWYTLGAIAGGVTGEPAPERTWQWQRSENGLTWVDITGADAATYTLVSEDANKYIRVQQTETNVLDSVTASSAATGLIEASIFSETVYANITPVYWGQLTTQTWD